MTFATLFQDALYGENDDDMADDGQEARGDANAPADWEKAAEYVATQSLDPKDKLSVNFHSEGSLASLILLFFSGLEKDMATDTGVLNRMIHCNTVLSYFICATVAHHNIGVCSNFAVKKELLQFKWFYNCNILFVGYIHVFFLY